MLGDLGLYGLGRAGRTRAVGAPAGAAGRAGARARRGCRTGCSGWCSSAGSSLAPGCRPIRPAALCTPISGASPWRRVVATLHLDDAAVRRIAAHRRVADATISARGAGPARSASRSASSCSAVATAARTQAAPAMSGDRGPLAPVPRPTADAGRPARSNSGRAGCSMCRWSCNGSRSVCATAISACRPRPIRDVETGGLCGENEEPTSSTRWRVRRPCAGSRPTSASCLSGGRSGRGGSGHATAAGPGLSGGRQAGYRLQRHRRPPDAGPGGAGALRCGEYPRGPRWCCSVSSPMRARPACSTSAIPMRSAGGSPPITLKRRRWWWATAVRPCWT